MSRWALASGALLLAGGLVGAGEPLYPTKGNADFGAKVMTLGLKPTTDLPSLEGNDTIKVWCGPRFYGGGFGCYRPFYGGFGGYSCYRPYWGGYYGGGFGCYRPFYSYSYYSYSPYYYGGGCYGGFCGIAANSGNIAPSVRLGEPGAVVQLEPDGRPALTPMPTAKEPTFPYDGGPRNAVPAPPADGSTTPEKPAPRPMVPAEGRVVSLPAKKPTPAVEYPAFGDDQPRKKTGFAEDRVTRR